MLCRCLKNINASRFGLMACKSSVFSNLVAGGHYKTLSNVVDNLRMVGGMLNIMPGEKSNLSPTSEYIIKVSYYNNLDVEARNADLMAIGQKGAQISNTWTNDAILTPTASMGLIRPDELTFIYYAETGQGEEFRKNNSNMMKVIGAFNRDHTVIFSYLAGQLTR